MAWQITPTPDLTNQEWRFPEGLEYVGGELNENTVLDYFAASPYFDRHVCIGFNTSYRLFLFDFLSNHRFFKLFLVECRAQMNNYGCRHNFQANLLTT